MTHTICTAITLNGNPCQAWAVRGSDPPLCVRHGGQGEELTPPADPPLCQASTVSGRTCQAWAVRGSDPPRCHAHLEEGPEAGPLTAEAALLRQVMLVQAIVERLAAYVHEEPELPARDLALLAARVFDGARTVAGLLRAERALSGEAADGLSGALAQALDELSTEWEIDI